MPETGDVVLAPVESVRVGSLESVIAQSVPHQWAGGGDCVGGLWFEWGINNVFQSTVALSMVNRGQHGLEWFCDRRQQLALSKLFKAPLSRLLEIPDGEQTWEGMFVCWERWRRWHSVENFEPSKCRCNHWWDTSYTDMWRVRELYEVLGHVKVIQVANLFFLTCPS